MAFAAGTGILTFIDFVACIARQALRATVGEKSSVNKSVTGGLETQNESQTWRFVLYASFLNEQQAIGLQLCEALDKFCKAKGLKDFKLVVRLSSSGEQKRWDETYIRDALLEHQISVSDKVWVCGPPHMSEVFDRCFDSILKDRFLGLTKSNLHVF